MDRTRTLGTVMGVARLGVGGTLALAPQWAGRLWLGDAARTPTAQVLARSVGARDAVVGVATLAALQNRKPTAELLTVGFAGGFVDAVSTALAAKHLDSTRRWLMPAVAASVAGLGVLATQWALAADRLDPATADLTDDGDPASPAAEDEVTDLTDRSNGHKKSRNKQADAKAPA